MQVSVNIGQNRHFALHEALFIYHADQKPTWEAGSTFVTHHPVMTRGGKRAEIGPGKLLTTEFVQSLLQALGSQLPIEYLPDHIVARTDRVLAWWTPAQQRPMFFGKTQGDLHHLSGHIFPQPALIWMTHEDELKVRAIKKSRRPRPETTLAVAPYWNVYDSGNVCLGSMRVPKVSTVDSIEQWEKSFYESEFTHGNVGRATRHPGGFEGLWKQLDGTEAFPLDTLIELPETVEEFLTGKRRAHAA